MTSGDWAQAFETRKHRRARKRLAVLRTGARLFNQRGYERTTLDDIAEALNVSKRTLYYYVRSKEEILAACNRLGLEDLRGTMEAPEEGPPLARIEALSRRYVSFLNEDMGLCNVLSTSVPTSAALADEIRAERRKIDHALRRMIEEGVADGSIRPCDARLTTAAIFGSLNWFPFWNRREPRAPLEAAEEAAIRLALSSLRA